LDFIQLLSGLDEFRRNLNANGAFSIDSLYKAILQSDIPIDNKNKIWKMKIPLKTNIFGWYLCRGVILTDMGTPARAHGIGTPGIYSG
jgi:hypothetical protein